VLFAPPAAEAGTTPVEGLPARSEHREDTGRRARPAAQG
jgi:hypothetical protein